MGTSEPIVPDKLELNDSGCIQDEKHDESLPKENEESSMENGSSRQPQLLDLSDDVLLCILKFCSAHDLKALGFSCTRLGRLVVDRSLWTRVRCPVACDRERMRWLLARLHAGTTELRVIGTRQPPPLISGEDRSRKADQEKKTKRRTPATNSGENNAGENCAGAHRDEQRIGRRDWHCDNHQQNGGIEGPFPLLRQRAHRHINTLPLPRDTGPMSCAEGGAVFPLSAPLLRGLRAACPDLHTLCLDYCNINCKKTKLSQFPPRLVHLSLRGSKCYNLPLDKTFLFKINDYLPMLEFLDLSECEWLEPAALLPLSKAPVLQTLLLRDCPAMTEFVAYMSLATRYGFRQLKVLDLRGCGVGDSEVAALGWLPALAELRLAAPATPPPPPHPAPATPTPHQGDTVRADWELKEPEYYKGSHEPDSAESSPEDIEGQVNQIRDHMPPVDHITIYPRSNIRLGEELINGQQPTQDEQQPMETEPQDEAERDNRKRKLDDENTEEEAGPSKINRSSKTNGTDNEKLNDDFDENSNSSSNDCPIPMSVNICVERENTNSKANADDPTVDPLSLGNEFSDASSLGKQTTDSSACSCKTQTDASNEDKQEVDASEATQDSEMSTTIDSFLYDKDNSSNDSQFSDFTCKPAFRESTDENKDETLADNSQDCDHSNPIPSTSRGHQCPIIDTNTANENKSLKRKLSDSDTDSDDDDDKKPDEDANKKVAQRKRDNYCMNIVNINTTALFSNDYVIKVSYERVLLKDKNKKSKERSNSADENKEADKNAEKENTDKKEQDKDKTEQNKDNTEQNKDKTEQNKDTTEHKKGKTEKNKGKTKQNKDTTEKNKGKTKQNKDTTEQKRNTSKAKEPQEANNEPGPSNRERRGPQQRYIRFRRSEDPLVVCPTVQRRIENHMNEFRARHHVLYVNFGQQFHLMPSHRTRTSFDNSSLISDSAIRRFGRADGEEINIVNIGPNLMPGIEPIGERPNRSSLRILQATGFRGITNRSLVHLATSAPHLRHIDFSNTSVTQEGVENFRNQRPDCEVVFSAFTEDKPESSE